MHGLLVGAVQPVRQVAALLGVGQVGERGALPEAEGFAEQGGGCLAVRLLAGAGGERTEAVDVDRLGIAVEEVARGVGRQGEGGPVQVLAQRGDVTLEDGLGLGGGASSHSRS